MPPELNLLDLLNYCPNYTNFDAVLRHADFPQPPSQLSDKALIK